MLQSSNFGHFVKNADFLFRHKRFWFSFAILRMLSGLSRDMHSARLPYRLEKDLQLKLEYQCGTGRSHLTQTDILC